jgi:hypothetical protein
MKPSAVIAVSVALTLFASAFFIWHLARGFSPFASEPRVIGGTVGYASMAIWAAVNAVLLPLRRPGARISVLFFAGALIVWNLTSLFGALSAAMELPQDPTQAARILGKLAARFVMLAAAIWWLVVLNREPMRREFSLSRQG